MFRFKPIFVVLLWICLADSQNIGYFWHITDMHWDPTYNSTSKALSCNPGTTGSNFGKYGDFRCDPPWELINSSVHAMRTIREDVDFLIWTGDDTPHIWDDTILSPSVVSEIVLRQSDILQQVFPSHMVYSALGNHDWSPKNQIPPRPDPFYDVIADKWAPWLDADANATFRKAAYYTMKLPGQPVRMVSINTNLYYESNSLTESMPDPANQLQWLDDVMTEAARNGEKVIIVGHVPPGVFEKHRNKHWFYPYYNQVFTSLLKKHAATISGVHMAHHHTDSFRIVYDDSGAAVASVFLGPAVSPWETTLDGTMGGLGNNPSVRLVEYDRATGRTVDIHQYYLNLTAANSLREATWELEYSAREYYDLPDLSPASLHGLKESMRTDDAQFSRYYSANGVRYDPNEKWTEEYRTVHVCAIENLDYGAFADCFDPPGVSMGPQSMVPDVFVGFVSLCLCLWVRKL